MIDVGPYILPVLAATIIIMIAWVTIYWIFDPSEPPDIPEGDEEETPRRRGRR